MAKAVRQTWIDYARGIAIILVLYRHVFEGIKNAGISISDYLYIEHANILFFSFRMPLFFIVSGIFVAGSLQKRGLREFAATKVRNILYPYFLWGILQITVQLLLSRYVNADRTIFSYLDLLYTPRNIDQFWYLYALFNVTMLYVIVLVTLKPHPYVNLAVGAILFYLSAFAIQHQVNLYFVGDIMHFYLYLAIGDMLSAFIRDKANLEYFQSWKILLLLVVPFIASQYYFLHTNLMHPETGNYLFVEFYQPFAFITIALTGAAFVLQLSFFLQKINIMQWLHRLGSHSLYIYVSHVMVLAAVRIFMTKALGIYNVPLLLILGITTGLAIPVIIYKLAVKLNMRWLFTLERQEHTKHYINAIQVAEK